MHAEQQDHYPLFPLGGVLFPGGRMALRIFERRYLDLLRNTLRDDGHFGIVHLHAGSEVDGKGDEPRIAAVGCQARVVDWDQTEDGLLSVVVEGGPRFRLLHSYRDDAGLNRGRVEWLSEQADIPLPEEAEELSALLAQLLEHPHVQRMGFSAEVSGTGELVNRLAQLLPLSPEGVYPLLEIDEPLHRLDALHDLLESLSQ
ncbi:MAG: LON peptidase substrate-binding domain-containing protein [Spongiibacter marinus]|uniref:LON peptidase substrate-binding domain-containing protein n=1 Tax=Spongiibacter marinus TaxID=354246 RepID=UPI003C38E512